MNPWFAGIFVTLLLALLVVELWGVSRKDKAGKGDTITELWRWIEHKLRIRQPWAAWTFRIFTAGILIWALGHFLGGWS